MESLPIGSKVTVSQVKTRIIYIPLKKICAKRCNSNRKLSFSPFSSTCTLESIQLVPRGTRQICFLSPLTRSMILRNILCQESKVCLISGCTVNQEYSSGVGSAGKSVSFFNPFFRNIFSFFGSVLISPRSRNVDVDNATAILISATGT